MGKIPVDNEAHLVYKNPTTLRTSFPYTDIDTTQSIIPSWLQSNYISAYVGDGYCITYPGNYILIIKYPVSMSDSGSDLGDDEYNQLFINFGLRGPGPVGQTIHNKADDTIFYYQFLIAEYSINKYNSFSLLCVPRGVETKAPSYIDIIKI